MVVISRPSARAASDRHDFTRLPSISTVQAPHWPRSQPFLEPVRWRCSRRASSSVVRGSSARMLGSVDAQHDAERGKGLAGALCRRWRLGSSHDLSSRNSAAGHHGGFQNALAVSDWSWSSSNPSSIGEQYIVMRAATGELRDAKGCNQISAAAKTYLGLSMRRRGWRAPCLYGASA